MRTRATRRPPHERRKLILDGAEGVFAASGYAGADTTALARAGGVSAPALYRYFPTKKDLFIETLKLSGERLAEIWTRILDESADPIEAMERISLAYSEHSGSRPSVMRIWFQALSDTDAPEVREVLRSSIAKLAGLLEGNLQEAQRLGLVDGDVDPRVATWDFMAIGFTFEISRLIGMGADLDQGLFRDWIRHHFKTIGARRGGQPGRRADG
jgi:TetR/AcrR family transcriptional regulator